MFLKNARFAVLMSCPRSVFRPTPPKGVPRQWQRSIVLDPMRRRVRRASRRSAAETWIRKAHERSRWVHPACGGALVGPAVHAYIVAADRRCGRVVRDARARQDRTARIIVSSENSLSDRTGLNPRWEGSLASDPECHSRTAGWSCTVARWYSDMWYSPAIRPAHGPAILAAPVERQVIHHGDSHDMRKIDPGISPFRSHPC